MERHRLIACCASLGILVVAMAAHAAPLAATSFEVAEGYPAPPPAYDVRSITPTDGAGWGSNTWAGNNGGAAYTFVAADATAYDGGQYMVLHREDGGSANREIILRRKYNTALIQDQRVILSLAFRLDAERTEPDYFDSAFNVYLERGTSSNLGDENVRLEFTKEGDIKVRADDLSSSLVVGQWDDPGQPYYALNTWATLTFDVDVAAQRVDYYVNGEWLGNYLFNDLLSAGEVLDEIRFKGPRAYDGSPNDGVSIDDIRLNTGLDEPVPGCRSSVRPGTPASAVANINEPASPASFAYTVLNIGSETLNWTAVEADASGNPTEYGWLSLDEDSGSLASLGETTITASIDTTGLAGGVYTAYIKIADDCDPAGSHLRQIDLTVIACEWTVDSCNQVRIYNLEYPDAPVEPVTYRISNTGLHPFNFSVNKTGSSCFEWLTLDTAGDTIQPGGYADVTASIHPEALAGHTTDDSYACNLVFTDDCSAQSISRNVRIRYLGIGDTQVFAYDGTTDPENDDSAGEGFRFRVAEGVTAGGVEPDGDAENGYAWRIVDPAGQKTKYEAVRWRQDNQEWDNLDIYSEAGATILARLRVRSWGPNDNEDRRDGGLYLWEEDSISATLHWGGATDGVLMDRSRDGQRVTLTPTDDYVIVRMTSIGREGDDWDCSRIVRLYMNENPVPVLEILSAGEESNTDKEGFGFGAGSTDGTYDIAFDWVAGTNAGAFGPGEELAVLGRSLIPKLCPAVFADADEDGDVDQDDFGEFQACFTGANDPNSQFSRPDCGCFDQDRDDDVDEDDYGAFQQCASGPEIPLDPACVAPAQ